VDLQNDFTTGDNRYPKNRQQTLHLLDKYKAPHLPREAVEAVVEAAIAMEKAMSPALMMKSTGRIRSITNTTRWGILQPIVE
jgi:hypothetical protein